MKINITICILLIASNVWAGTFRDNFDDGDLEGWIKSDPWNVGSLWTIENGELIGVSNHAKGWDTHLYLKGSELWKDYEISVKSKIVECSSNNLCGTGLLARRFNPQRYVQFAVLLNWDGVGEAVTVYEMDAGVNVVDNREEFDIELDTWYDLSLTVSGNNYKCFINNTEVLGPNLNKFGNGAVGLAINGGKIHFDNFVVTGDEISGFAAEAFGALTTKWSQIKKME